MTLLAGPFIPKAGRRSSKKPWPGRLLKLRNAVSAIPIGLRRSRLGILGPFHRDVTRRFGLVPNFFMSAPDAPEIVEKLWDFAKSAYLDNPIPSLFKERLFVFLSRFCQVRYCIVRHCGFLVGYGHSSGDASAAPQTIEQALKLLKMPPPWRRQLEPIYEAPGGIQDADRLARPGQRGRRLDICGFRCDLCRADEVRARPAGIAASTGRQTL